MADKRTRVLAGTPEGPRLEQPGQPTHEIADRERFV